MFKEVYFSFQCRIDNVLSASFAHFSGFQHFLAALAFFSDLSTFQWFYHFFSGFSNLQRFQNFLVVLALFSGFRYFQRFWALFFVYYRLLSGAISEKTKKICHHEVTQLVNLKIIMLEFSRHLWQLKFTGKIRPAPFRGEKQAKFKVTGKKVKK